MSQDTLKLNTGKAQAAFSSIENIKARFIMTPQLMRLNQLAMLLADSIDPDDASAVEWIGELEELTTDLVVGDDEIELVVGVNAAFDAQVPLGLLDESREAA